jgi:hypothetical protein
MLAIVVLLIGAGAAGVLAIVSRSEDAFLLALPAAAVQLGVAGAAATGLPGARLAARSVLLVQVSVVVIAAFLSVGLLALPPADAGALTGPLFDTAAFTLIWVAVTGLLAVDMLALRSVDQLRPRLAAK